MKLHFKSNKNFRPLLDRIDVHIEVTPVALSELSSERAAVSSEKIRERALCARKIQPKRFKKNVGAYSNTQMGVDFLYSVCKIDVVGQTLLKNAIEIFGSSCNSLK